jgi:hypothetical protein
MRLPIVVLLFTATVAARAGVVVDTFENDANPNQWSWAGGDPASGAGINDSGGHPGPWMDSGVPFINFEPQIVSFPPAGSALRAALDSAEVRTASIDLERLDASDVQTCQQHNYGFKTFAFAFNDFHSGDLPISGISTAGPAAPFEYYPWTRVRFAIPSDSPTTPRGWVLVNAPHGYTWADLMHNTDSVSFFAFFSPFLQPGACWHLGADNIVITYGARDGIFDDAFDDGGDDSGPVHDPSFEATAASGGTNPHWASSDSNVHANGASVLYSVGDTGALPRSGHYVAWFGGWNAGSETQTISQTVTLPAGGPLYLNYYRQTAFQVDTTDFPGTFVVSIDDIALETTDLGTQGDVDYVPHSIDISAFADGGSHEVKFQYDYNAQDSLSDGSTFVDDVTIDATPIPADW